MRALICVGACWAGLGLAAAAAAPPPAPPSGPEALVRRLYAQKEPPISHAGFARYFSADLTAAYWRDRAAADRRGEVPLLDSDYRYDAQDADITALSLTSGSVEARRAQVIARFRNFGKPTEIGYTLCRRADGAWRIKELSMPSGSLRRLYHLAPADRAPGC